MIIVKNEPTCFGELLMIFFQNIDVGILKIFECLHIYHLATFHSHGRDKENTVRLNSFEINAYLLLTNFEKMSGFIHS